METPTGQISIKVTKTIAKSNQSLNSYVGTIIVANVVAVSKITEKPEQGVTITEKVN
jgi:hypothetical protein